jgi:hypothetical protein
MLSTGPGFNISTTTGYQMTRVSPKTDAGGYYSFFGRWSNRNFLVPARKNFS